MMSIWIGICLYFGIGLGIYFTLPNRKQIPVSVSLPFIVAWFFLSFFFLFHQPKSDKK